MGPPAIHGVWRVRWDEEVRTQDCGFSLSVGACDWVDDQVLSGRQHCVQLVPLDQLCSLPGGHVRLCKMWWTSEVLCIWIVCLLAPPVDLLAFPMLLLGRVVCVWSRQAYVRVMCGCRELKGSFVSK